MCDYPKRLKSNMDRFIVGVFNRSYAMNFSLKSNMDRFIVLVLNNYLRFVKPFKIQYG